MSLRSLLIGCSVLIASGAGAELARAGEGHFRVNRGRVTVIARWGRSHDVRAVRRAIPYRHHRNGCCRFVPGYYEARATQVYIPGFYRQQYVPPVYHTYIDRYGWTVQTLVRAGYTRTIWVPGRYEMRTVNVWVPGYTVCNH